MTNIALTDKAAEQIKLFAKEHSADTDGKTFRIFIQASGCSGYEYGFTFDHERPNDLKLSHNDVDFLVDPKSAKFLQNCVMDYKETIQATGFVIQNPQVKSTCGCGSSFEI